MIAYIECIRRKLEIYDLNGQIITVCSGKKLSEFAAQLGDGFACCHQSIYVNMQHILEIRRYALRLRGGIEFPISQSRFRALRGSWGEYLGGTL